MKLLEDLSYSNSTYQIEKRYEMDIQEKEMLIDFINEYKVSIKKINEPHYDYIRAKRMIRYIELIGETQITDEQAWNKIAEAYPETVQSLRITLDHAVFGTSKTLKRLQELESDWSQIYDSEKSFDEWVEDQVYGSKEKVKVPAFVGEWIKKHCYVGKYVCLERFMCQYNNVELPTDLYNYYDRDKDGARDKIISAILDGYEVEEEQRWAVKLKFGRQYLSEDSNGTAIDFYSFMFPVRSYTKKELAAVEDGAFYKIDGDKEWVNPIIELIPAEKV